MQKINYLDILKHSWQIIWSNKYLWWFGFFLSLGSFSGSFNFNWSSNEQIQNKNEQQLLESFNNFLDKYWTYVLIGIIILVVLTLILLILKVICRAGLIKSVQKIIAGRGTNFKEGFHEGKEYFWNLLFLALIVGFFILGIIIVLATPVVFLVVIKSYFWAVFLGLAAFLILIVLLILAAFLREYASLYLVLSNLKIYSSLESAFNLFKKNLGPSVIFSLIIMAVGIIFGIGMFMILIIITLVFLAVGFLAYAIFAKAGAITIAVIGGLILLLTAILFQSVFETFRQTSWILFFQEITVAKVEEKIKEKETARVIDKVLEGGEI